MDARRAECNLRCIEQLGSFIGIDCAEENGLRNTGNEVADVFVPNERRKCGAECSLSGSGCGEFVVASGSLDFIGAVVGLDQRATAREPDGCDSADGEDAVEG